jgi:RNA polymerase sigma-70 factor (ECF subfamily)
VREDGLANGRDEEGFRRDAVACLDGLFSFALSLSRDRVAAEDLVQETYVRALRASRHPEEPSGIRSWLFTILHNVWRNERRRRAPEPLDTLPERLEPRVAADVERALDSTATSERLAGAIEALPEAYREVVMLRYGEGFSYQEIADILRCPAGTVMSRLSRARSLLRHTVAAAGKGSS